MQKIYPAKLTKTLKYFFLAFAFCLGHLNLHAQKNKIDSLKKDISGRKRRQQQGKNADCFKLANLSGREL
jgi:hypothetical protein